ncbi:aminotransferase class I/II-fold pyridoxal phosphate-dependent enzyme [Teredinibacter sp. KSP-S5-2]|uniref:aminotransferase class I/II-fold pyridoxal phosphate-dependent enzyme n=1 Tax=Teredinibacter sp. KSP-S5-2 TaxID=3034506 RepID=UPI00293527B5|nr:aminotransferase class I/II-fold pyridoxal phosphate-dependent enzyme [Teredinibacter sp. KSP-S5-2]WNO08367.1 aminotransferase class I/II-fold pyridoxal phosphate-dependent enzyme [Teredinibacter sp. KSP-S5-2]
MSFDWTQLPEHGGDTRWASNFFSIPEKDLLDLSTGISPWPWPIPDIPQTLFTKLSRPDGPLLLAAAAYYGCNEEQLIAMPGSQYAIEELPKYFSVGRVAIPKVGYSEHKRAWLSYRHAIIEYERLSELESLVLGNDVDYAVVINPNNPTTEHINEHKLNGLVEQSSCVFIVDEAFMDATPENSIIRRDMPSNIIVLRSMGKFFGLPGLRVGFVIANVERLKQFKGLRRLWSLSPVSIWLAEQALADKNWINQHVEKLNYQSTAFAKLLQENLAHFEFYYSAFFATTFDSKQNIFALFQMLGKQGLYTRIGLSEPDVAWLRIGLPHDLPIFSARLIQSE